MARSIVLLFALMATVSVAASGRAVLSSSSADEVERKYYAYPGKACREDNDGKYYIYTLRECMEKCTTRDCDAFVFWNTQPGDSNDTVSPGLCKLYDECEKKTASDVAQVLFVVP